MGQTKREDSRRSGSISSFPLKVLLPRRHVTKKSYLIVIFGVKWNSMVTFVFPKGHSIKAKPILQVPMGFSPSGHIVD